MAAAATDKFIKGARRFSTTLSGSIDDSVTTIPLTSVVGLPTDTAVVITIDRVDSSGVETLSNEEVIVGTVSGSNIINAVRGFEGTAQSHSASAVVECHLVAAQHGRLVDGLLAEHAQDGTHTDITADSVNTAILKGWDGWLADTDTWVYVSASSFKIVGKDVTAKFPKGTRVSYNDGSVDYGVVAGAAFSSDTTVTLAANTDYAIANDTLTAPRYSYMQCPQGYPQWYEYTPTHTGYSSDPTGEYRFKIDGDTVMVNVAMAANGTSDSTSTAISLPVTSLSLADNEYFGSCAQTVDNGSNQTTPGSWRVQSNASVALFYLNASPSSNWTASGGKRVRCQIVYRI